MNRDEFWSCIDAARQADSAAPEEGLRALLEQKSADDVIAFQRHFDEAFDAAYRWDLWGAAYVIEGGCSDDGFADFRYGLIALGREPYERAIVDPDSLAAVEGEISNEGFGYVANEVLEAKGASTERVTPRPPSPAGEDWDFDDPAENARRLPRLHERHG